MKHILGITILILFFYACHHETVRMDEYEVHGIDVSHYQSRIEWDSVAAANIHFAFVKATEGATYKDSLYCHNWAEMKRVDIKRGAYHFFRPQVPAIQQVENFANAVKVQNGDLPPVLDVEVLDGVSKEELIVNMHTWLYLIELKYGVKPIIYTYIKFYNRYLDGHFDDYPIWIARYNDREPRLASQRQWDFWQYGNTGRIPGIEGDVDFNVFHGTHFQLEEMCIAPSTVYIER